MVDEDVLKKEREATLKDGSSIMYDTTAFNFTMMYGLDAVTVPEHINNNLSMWQPALVEIDVDDDVIVAWPEQTIDADKGLRCYVLYMYKKKFVRPV